MTLPPIPDEAVQAVLRTFLPEGRGFEEGEGQWAREDLEAAWPILYATAAQHLNDQFAAADEAGEFGDCCSNPCRACDVGMWLDDRAQEAAGAASDG